MNFDNSALDISIEYIYNFLPPNSIMNVAIMKNNSVIYSNCKRPKDTVNVENQIQLNLDTRFNIGSISKIFLVVAVLILVDKNKINLDEKVIKYLPEFKMEDLRYKKISVRMLLNYSSGLRGTAALFYSGYKFNDVRKDFLKNLSKSTLQYNPGEMKIYCDDGFFLAQILVEKISGQSFMNFLNDYVFKPLKLKRTMASLGESLDYKDKNIACNLTNINLLETISAYGIAGLSSSVLDLCIFGYALIKNNKIFSKSSRKELFQPQNFKFSIELSDLNCFGLGWDFIFEIDGEKVFLKRGRTSDYISYFMILPKSNIIISLLIFSHLAKINEQKILSALFGKLKINEKKEIKNSDYNLTEYLGFYVNRCNIYFFDYDYKNKKLMIFSSDAYEENKYLDCIYKNIFKDGLKNINKPLLKENHEEYYSFQNINGRRFFSKFVYPYSYHKILFEKVENIKLKDEIKLVIKNLNNKLWFRNKCFVYELKYSKNDYHMTPSHIIRSKYLNFSNLIDFEGTKKVMSVSRAIPICPLDRQAELKLLYNKAGKIISANLNGRTYIPQEQILKANLGLNIIKLNQPNVSKWIEVNDYCKIDIEIPKNSRVLIFTKKLNLIYDSIVKNDSTCVQFCFDKLYIECISEVFNKFNINIEQTD